MGKKLYGNSHFERGKEITKNGVKYFTLTSGKYRTSDPNNTCKYGHVLDIKVSDIEKKKSRGFCTSGGKGYEVELKSGASLLEPEKYDDLVENEPSEEVSPPDDCDCISTKENLDKLPLKIRDEVMATLKESDKSLSNNDCNEICMECREQALNNLISCLRHANSPEAKQECNDAYFLALQGCWS